MSLTLVDYLVLTNEDWRDTLDLFVGDDPETGDPVDLTGSSFRAQLRTSEHTLNVSLECSTTNGRLVVDEPASGRVSWNVPPEILRTLEPGVYVYDMVWTNAGGVEDTFIAGTVTIKRGITRP